MNDGRETMTRIVRWARIELGRLMVLYGVRLLPKEPEVEEALYRWIARSHLHRERERILADDGS